MRYFFFLFILSIATEGFGQQPVSLLKTRLKIGPDSSKINSYLEISKAYEEIQPDSAVDYCSQGLKFAEKRGDFHGQGMLLLQLGHINALHQQAELARKFYNDALSIFRHLHENEDIAQATNYLGLLDGQQLDMLSATQDLNSALRSYQATHDHNGVIQTYNSLGLAYEESGKTEIALTYYLRALVQYEKLSQKPDAYFVLLDRIGHLYLKKKDTQNALRYLEEGIHSKDTAGLRDTQIDMMDEEGKIFEKEGEKARALGFYEKELAGAKKFNRLEEQAKALISIAGILKKEDATKSMDDLQKAMRIAKGLHQPQLESTIYAAQADIYRHEKDYKQAMDALEAHDNLLDSLVDKEKAEEKIALDSSYALENSRQQIGGLERATKQEKKELDTSLVILIAVIILLLLIWLYLRKVRLLNRELAASNRVKDTLFSIIGHDLKGPAGSAAQLFDLMETEAFSEAETKQMISEIRKQTHASFELLNGLFEWGKAQLQGVQIKQVHFDTHPVIQQNIRLLSQKALLKNITITDHSPADVRIFADPNQFDFIIRNLLSNAIKFTFPFGFIDIGAVKGDGEMIFSVRDTGIGITEKQQQLFLKTNLSVAFGTAGEKGSGLGLLLIKEFMQANKGKIWLESEEGKGTTFYFSFPLN